MQPAVLCLRAVSGGGITQLALSSLRRLRLQGGHLRWALCASVSGKRLAGGRLLLGPFDMGTGLVGAEMTPRLDCPMTVSDGKCQLGGDWELLLSKEGWVVSVVDGKNA